MTTTDTPRTDSYYAGKGCECAAHDMSECGCGVDWTDPRIYELKAKIERIMSLLKDPSAVHINLLRGDIAGLSWDAYEHIHGPHPCRERAEKAEAEVERLKALPHFHHESSCRKCGSTEIVSTDPGF